MSHRSGKTKGQRANAMRKFISHAGFAHRPSAIDCAIYFSEEAVATNPASDTNKSA
jgi:hypothetical protein